MEKQPCSIFNDVIGPVMRGPSSSHVAGAARIADLVRQAMPGKITHVLCDFDPTGALAASHIGHGTDMGFACGLLGIPLSNPQVDRYEELAKEAGLSIEYRILEYGAVHPGNYRIQATDDRGNCRHFEAVALGGGMIEMQKYEGHPVQVSGDYYEVLILSEAGLEEKKFSRPRTESELRAFRERAGVKEVVYLEPVLPTLSGEDVKVPYRTAAELLAYAEEHPMEPWEYAAYYESCRGGKTVEEDFCQMEEVLDVMEAAVENGLAGTQYEDRILGAQSPLVAKAEKAGRLLPDAPLNSVIRCISAVMESKSSMGLIVAAPTCGSCGCLPGTIIGLAKVLEFSREDCVKALLVAGLIGVFFGEQATFSAEVGGCQVECGAASGLAAAGIVQLVGGTVRECVDAASVALQNITGLACDPVGNRVEVPCLGKNIMAGSNAIASANMILSGFDKVVPLDETIQAIYDIGLSLPLELRCTYGGLGKTKTGQHLWEKMNK